MQEENNVRASLDTKSKYCYPDTDILINSQGIKELLNYFK